MRIYVCTVLCPSCLVCLLWLAGAPCIVPMAATYARNAPVARDDKSGTDTILQHQGLADYEARLRQEGRFGFTAFSTQPCPVPCVPHGTGHG